MDKLLEIIQLLLVAAALVCIMIAAATVLFGNQNTFQNTPYLALGIWLLISGWLIKAAIDR